MATSKGLEERSDSYHRQSRIAQEAEAVANVTGAEEKDWVCWEVIKELNETRKRNPRIIFICKFCLVPFVSSALLCPHSQLPTKIPQNNIRKHRDFFQMTELANRGEEAVSNTN